MTLKNRISTENRKELLINSLEKGFARVIEAHNGISALVGNDISIENNNAKIEFDALWVSSLTDSAAKGHPDSEIVSLDSRLKTINEILEATNKPVIVDGDTGGTIEHFEYMVKKLERTGVSAVIIEDKIFPKKNSLDLNATHDLEDPKIFAEKIKRGKKILTGNNFMIIARIESLIAGIGQEDALKRAEKYLLAGADGIMIHSKSKSPEEILKFAEDYNKLCKKLGFRKPLVCVPTTYNSITESELKEKGFNIVIHANHLLRASYKAMENVCKVILLNQRSLEADQHCASVSQILEKIG